MRSSIGLSVFATLISATGALAQMDDAAICGRLTRGSYSPGHLYVAYPASSAALYYIRDRAICTDDGASCATAVTADNGNIYIPQSRFFFLPKPKTGTEEGVFHVRTQTIAENLAGAERAYVYRRPALSTRCSKGTLLPSFTEEESMMSVRRYQDHHPPLGGSRPTDFGMKTAFHLQIEDKPSSCFNSDDERVYGDLDKLYNFEKVRSNPQNWAKLVSTAAVAGETPYAGLSAEFAYQDTDKPLCFGFTAPRPTMSDAGGPVNWKPVSTLVVIKRFVRRTVQQDLRQEIMWRP